MHLHTYLNVGKNENKHILKNGAFCFKAAIESSWASITPQQCHMLIASMPCGIEAVISAKGFPTKY